MKYLSLFTGIGGMDLGLDRAGMTCIGQVEIDPYCRAVLARHWPDVKRMEDVRDVTAESFERPDLICGGFPCQDISVAGKGAGLTGARSGLWYEMLRVIRASRPRWVLAENVPALRTRGADAVLDDLEGAGYTCWPLVVGAEHVGAPHRRHWVFIVGHLADTDQRGRWINEPGRGSQRGTAVGGSGAHLVHAQHGRSALEESGSEPSRASGGIPHPTGERWPAEGPGGGADGLTGDSGAGPMVHAERTGLEGHGADAGQPQGREPGGTGPSGPWRWPARPGEPQHEWEAPRLVNTHGRPDGRRIEQPEGGAAGRPVPREQREGFPQPRVGDGPDGLPRRVAGFARRNALRALGNAVVPQVAEVIGRAIMRADGVISS